MVDDGIGMRDMGLINRWNGTERRAVTFRGRFLSVLSEKQSVL